MWSRKRKLITILKNVLLFLVIIILTGGLVYAIKRVENITQEQDKELSEIRLQQQKQQNEARQESTAVIEAEYQKDMETVEKYMKGIVCWGDSITTGSSGNISYPSVLQKYIDTYICDIYDFRSTIANAEDFSRLDWNKYKVSIPVVNMGCEREDTNTILGRSGAVPYVTAADLTIPADTQPVRISLLSENGKMVSPLIGGDKGINTVTIAGIEGTLSLDSALDYIGNPMYNFTRTTPGSELTVTAGTEIKTAASDQFKDYIHVICIGTYGGYDYSPDVLVKQIQDLLSRQSLLQDRYIILGLYSVFNNIYQTQMLDTIDTAMMKNFGNHYINIRKYLCGDGLTDSGIVKTQEDAAALTFGAIPPSFLTGTGSIELNGKAQRLIGKVVFERMETLGYFDEIYDELNISETRKQIIINNPTYFDRIISSEMY